MSDLDVSQISAVPEPNKMQPSEAPPRRSDARRNVLKLLDAAAGLFVTSGVDVPVREVALRAGVGTGTIYRHFPTRADLIVAVYRHQVEACADAGPALMAQHASPYSALRAWIDLFVDFLTTKHGLAAVLQTDNDEFRALHSYFLERLVPVCAALLEAAGEAGEVQPDVEASALMRGVGSLCIGATTPHYNARRMVELLMAGLRRR